MKAAWLMMVWVLLPVAFQAAGQPFSQCKFVYFAKSKVVSTSVCLDKDERWGEARAFNRQGKEIYRADERRIAGHARTHFSYYPSGAVRKASYSSAPDAGIQWYEGETVFAENGDIISQSRRSHDDSPSLWRPTEQPDNLPPPPVACAEVFLAEVFLLNRSRFAVKVVGAYTGSVADPKTLTLAPGDSGRGGAFATSAEFALPADLRSRLALQAVGTRRRPTLRLLGPLRQRQLGKQVRQYVFAIE